MQIIGHGIDVVEIKFIQQQIKSANKDWIGSVYSIREQQESCDPRLAVRYFAGRFAGKEAVSKALGTGFSENITWRGIEILRDESGQPNVELTDEVLAYAKSLGIVDWQISLTYSESLAFASVIASGKG